MGSRVLKPFLDKYDIVIFDMDGVITSEQVYWDAASLTVYEYLNSSNYFGNFVIDPKWAETNVSEIRSKVFLNDRLISLLKGKGVNSNWDLGYVIVLISFILDICDGDAVYNYACGLSQNIIDEYERLAELAACAKGISYEKLKRNGELWCSMRDCFQEWYLGDSIFYEVYKKQPVLSGKAGLLRNELPIIDISDLRTVLGELSKTKRLCTGTGRPFSELVPPLKAWEILDFFAQDGLCNYDHVAAAEQKLNITLTKPHPYMFLKALYGTDYPDEKIISGDYDKTRIPRALVVGDAGADILAAKTMGADFCAVLTGVKGAAARSYFEELDADYILNSVKDMMEDK